MLLSFPHQFRMDPPADIRKTPTKSSNPVHRTKSGSPTVNYTSNSPNTHKFSHILANSRQFEVMYVGKVKVYQKRAPPTFIDDAVESFHANDDHKVKFNLLVETENDNGQSSNTSRKADDNGDQNSMNESGISTLNSFSMSTPQSPSNCSSYSSSGDNMIINELEMRRPRSISALTTCKEYKETFDEESPSSSSYPNSTCSSPQVPMVNSSSSTFHQIDAKESTRKSSSDTGFTELSSINSDLSFSKHTSSSSSTSNHPLIQLSSSISDERDSVFTDSETSNNGNITSPLNCTENDDLIVDVASIPRPKSSTGIVDLANSSANLLTSSSLITNTQSLDEGRRASIVRDLKAVGSSNGPKKLDTSEKNHDETAFDRSEHQSSCSKDSQSRDHENNNRVVEIGKRIGSSVSESSSIGDKSSSIMMGITNENSGSMNNNNNNCNEPISVDISDRIRKQASLPHRTRASSGGNGDLNRRAKQSAKYQNRTMLFLIGRLELCLLSPDLQQVLFSKTFNYVSHCSRGVKYADHFGFICRDTSLYSSDTYVGYVFRCQTEQLVNEIMHTLKQAFHNAHQAYLTSRNRNSTICDSCPMQWYHRFQCEVESVPPERAQALILERLDSLPEPEKSNIMSAYEGSKVSSVKEQNDIFMRLLREAFEKRQAKHIHNDKKSASALDNLKQKAKKSLSNSFETILKLAQGDTIDDIGGGMNSHSSSSSPRPEFSFSFDEHLGSSSSRPRSSTIGGVRDLQIHSTSTPHHRHLGASRSESIPLHPSTPIKGAGLMNNNNNNNNGSSSSISPLYNIFFKLGSQKSGSGSLHEDSISETCETSTSTGNNKEKSDINSGNGGHDGKGKVASKQTDRAWHRAIFRNVKANTQNMDKSNLVESMGLESIKENVQKRRSKQELRELWKKTINQQITLIRMEKENRKLQKKQSVVTHKRMKLDYEEISPCLKETFKMWEDVVKLDLNDPSLEYKLRDIIRKGVPRQKRGEIWLFLAKYNQTHGKIARNSGSDEVDLDKSYRELLKSLTSQQHAILVDLGRTFPKHPYFCQPLGAGQLSLFNLLKAYSLFDREVGYCQGLSFVAAILLLHVNEDDSFEMLKYLLFHIGFREQYKPDMSALQMQLYQLTRLLYDYHHKLYEHFDSFDIMPTLYAAPWFLTLFASQFPIGFVARLFDLIFFFGIEAVFRVSLALLASYKEILLQSKSFESIMEILRNDVPKMDVIQMERVFSQVFTMDISKPLIVYEAEYNVLQEEMLAGSFPSSSMNTNTNATVSIDTHSTKHASNTSQEVSIEAGQDHLSDLVKKLEAQNRSLQSQNMELQDQVHVAQSNVYSMESSLETYRSTVKRLEDRVRSLEEERFALFDSLNKLRKRHATDTETVKE